MSTDAPEESWGADDAVTHLYAVHYRSLVRLAALLVRDRSLAEEVVQDSFVAMHGAWRRLDDPERALAYLRRTVVNTSRSALRHRGVVQRHAPVLLPDTTDIPSAEHSAMVALEHQEVLRVMAALPGRQREVLVLRYYVDLTESDIADTLGISRGAVKSHASRGMSALRTALEASR